jgi:hypothetical protein
VSPTSRAALVTLMISLALPGLALAQAPAPAPDRYDTWWAGSLLAQQASSLGAGHTSVGAMSFYSDNYGTFDDAWNYTRSDDAHVVASILMAGAGITDRLDLWVNVATYFKHWSGNSSSQFGDLGVKLAFQILRGVNGRWLPDVTVYAKEVFPTGRYDRLTPALEGADAGGGGSFATMVGINVQKLLLLKGRHLLKLTANFAFQYSARASVTGRNTYGGGEGTSGVVDPGGNYMLLLGAEYPLSRRWVLALDLQFTHTGADKFFGEPGRGSDGSAATVGGAARNIIALAPAIELNITKELGLTAGLVWTPLAQNGQTAFGPGITLGFGL